MRRECFRKQLLKLEPKTSQFEIKHFLHVSQGSPKKADKLSLIAYQDACNSLYDRLIFKMLLQLITWKSPIIQMG